MCLLDRDNYFIYPNLHKKIIAPPPKSNCSFIHHHHYNQLWTLFIFTILTTITAVASLPGFSPQIIITTIIFIIFLCRVTILPHFLLMSINVIKSNYVNYPTETQSEQHRVWQWAVIMMTGLEGELRSRKVEDIRKRQLLETEWHVRGQEHRHHSTVGK